MEKVEEFKQGEEDGPKKSRGGSTSNRRKKKTERAPQEKSFSTNKLRALPKDGEVPEGGGEIFYKRGKSQEEVKLRNE